MKSASKKTRKRAQSPNESIQPTPKKIRSKQSNCTPVVDDITFSRPVTRSSNTPLQLCNEILAQGNSSRKNVKTGENTEVEVECHGHSAAAVTGPDEAVKSHAISVDKPKIITVSTSRRKTTAHVARPKTVGKSTLETLPPHQIRNYVPASVTDRSIVDMQPHSEFGTERNTLVATTSPEPHDRFPSNTLEPRGTSLDVFVRLSRIIVILTILLFAFASLVRLDHDKHDTHGNVSRSGRKMYSFLTLGIVQPWEWGVSRKDSALLNEAESLLEQSLAAIDKQVRQESTASAFLTESDDVAKKLQTALNELVLLNTTTTKLEESVTKIPQRDVATTIFEGLNSSLSKTRADVRRHCVSELTLHVVPAVGFSSQVLRIYDTINYIKKSLCTTQSCTLWHDYRISLKAVSDEIRDRIFDAKNLSQFKSVIKGKLSKLAEEGISNKIAPIAIRYVEDSFCLAEPKCAMAAAKNDMDIVTCLEKIIARRIDDVFGDVNIGYGSCVDVNCGRNVHGKKGAAGDRSSLQMTIHDLIYFTEMGNQLQSNAISLLKREIYFRRVCIAQIKSFVNEKFDLGEVDKSASRKRSNADRVFINFALAPRGSRVVPSLTPSFHHLTSPPLMPNFLSSVGLLDGYGDPSVVISSTLPRCRDDCYAFEGSSGNLTILLPGPTNITRVGVYQHDGAVIESFAVRTFRVYGWPELPRAKATVKNESEIFTYSNPLFMGEFSLDSQFQESSYGQFHEFSLCEMCNTFPPPRLEAVTIQFQENFGGSNFTCVYRVQLLGEP